MKRAQGCFEARHKGIEPGIVGAATIPRNSLRTPSTSHSIVVTPSGAHVGEVIPPRSGWALCSAAGRWGLARELCTARASAAPPSRRPVRRSAFWTLVSSEFEPRPVRGGGATGSYTRSDRQRCRTIPSRALPCTVAPHRLARPARRTGAAPRRARQQERTPTMAAAVAPQLIRSPCSTSPCLAHRW